MANLLFPEFLSDREQYHQAEVFWQGLWEGVVSRANRVHEWRSPWLNNRYADGSFVEQDGNPIFNAVNKDRGLAVRILQHQPPAAEEAYLNWWLDDFADKDDPEHLRELVLSCVLSDTTAANAAKLLSEWVTSGQVAHP